MEARDAERAIGCLREYDSRMTIVDASAVTRWMGREAMRAAIARVFEQYTRFRVSRRWRFVVSA